MIKDKDYILDLVYSFLNPRFRIANIPPIKVVDFESLNEDEYNVIRHRIVAVIGTDGNPISLDFKVITYDEGHSCVRAAYTCGSEEILSSDIIEALNSFSKSIFKRITQLASKQLHDISGKNRDYETLSIRNSCETISVNQVNFTDFPRLNLDKVQWEKIYRHQ